MTQTQDFSRRNDSLIKLLVIVSDRPGQPAPVDTRAEGHPVG